MSELAINSTQKANSSATIFLKPEERSTETRPARPVIRAQEKQPVSAAEVALGIILWPLTLTGCSGPQTQQAPSDSQAKPAAPKASAGKPFSELNSKEQSGIRELVFQIMYDFVNGDKNKLGTMEYKVDPETMKPDGRIHTAITLAVDPMYLENGRQLQDKLDGCSFLYKRDDGKYNKLLIEKVVVQGLMTAATREKASDGTEKLVPGESKLIIFPEKVVITPATKQDEENYLKP